MPKKQRVSILRLRIGMRPHIYKQDGKWQIRNATIYWITTQRTLERRDSLNKAAYRFIDRVLSASI